MNSLRKPENFIPLILWHLSIWKEIYKNFINPDLYWRPIKITQIGTTIFKALSKIVLKIK